MTYLLVMKYFQLCLLLFPLAASAAVYRWTDELGVVHYTDKPAPGAKAVDLQPLSTYSPAGDISTPRQADASKPALVSGYYHSLKILQPQPEATINNNEGKLTVRVQSEPILDTAAGHKLVIYLDGKDVYRGADHQAHLSDITRGAHMLYAEIVSGDRKLTTSDAITFYVQQASVLTGPRNLMMPQAPAAPKAPNVPATPTAKP